MIIDDNISIEGKGVSRTVRIFDAHSMAFITEIESNNQGHFSVELPHGTQAVMFISQDVDGEPFAIGHAYQRGDRVKVDGINEFRYEVYLPGVSGTAPEAWPQKAGELVSTGDVTFQCVHYHRPIAKIRMI